MANETFGIDNGGPSAAIVHQDRLVCVGSLAVPDLFTASRTGEWTDFRIGVGKDDDDAVQDAVGLNPDGTPILADGTTTGTSDFVTNASDGFWFQQAGGRGNRFHGLIQQEGLFVFGELGESIVPAGPFTGTTVEVRENSWYGSDVGRTAIIAGGVVVFLQQGGEDVRGIAWTEAQRKYVAPSMLTLAGAVFEKARDMTFQTSTGRHGDTVYVIDEDGSMATMLMRVGDQIPAWSKWSTPQGRIVGAAAPLGEMVMLVDRGGDDITTGSRVRLETFDHSGTRQFDAEAELDNYADAPFWMVGVDGLSLRNLHIDPSTGDEVETPEERAVRVNASRQLEVYGGSADDVGTVREDPSQWGLYQTSEDVPTRGVVGFEYERAVETLPFVAQANSGLKRSIRKVRIMDVAIDFVQPPDPQAMEGSQGNVPRDAYPHIAGTTVSVVALTSSRRPLRRRPLKRVIRDTPTILRCRYGSLSGWRYRIALQIESRRNITIAGLSYRAVG